MKDLIKKLWIGILDFFKHDCESNKRIVSSSYFKDGNSGYITLNSRVYCCTKCNKKFST